MPSTLRSSQTSRHALSKSRRQQFARWPLLVYTDAMFRPRKRKRRDCDYQASELSEWKAKFVSKLGIVLYDPHCDPDNAAYDPGLVSGCDDGHLVYASATTPRCRGASEGLRRPCALSPQVRTSEYGNT